MSKPKLFELIFQMYSLPVRVDIECPHCKETIDVHINKGTETSFSPATTLNYPPKEVTNEQR